MAKIFEVKPATISNWENDQRQPERFMPTVQKWAEVTGCSEGWLLGIDAALGYKRHPAGLSLVASSE
jgi:transcriptional regulator with XRE-family HTH domain